MNLLVQVGMTGHPDLKGVPVLIDLTTSPKQREMVSLLLRRNEIAWPITALPGTPPDRLKALRTAFDKTMKDSEFNKEAEKLSISVNPKTGDEVSAIVSSVYKAPPDVVATVQKLLNP